MVVISIAPFIRLIRHHQQHIGGLPNERIVVPLVEHAGLLGIGFGRWRSRPALSAQGQEGYFPLLALHPSGSLILTARCDSPTQMPLCLVPLENHLYLSIQPRIRSLQPFAQVFMYSRLGYPKLFCCRADCRVVFYHVYSQFAGSFLHVVFQGQHSLHIL